MKILCLDSTAKIASAAILENDSVLAEYTVHGGGRSHSELLLPMIRSLLSSTSLTEDDIDLFACTSGPGSFTGVRIGVSLIKGLAFGRGKPCCAVSAPMALAENLAPTPGLYCPVMDARRDQVYTALFRHDGSTMTRLMPDSAMATAELAALLLAKYPGEPVTLVGDGYEIARAALSAAGVPLCEPPILLRGQSAAAAGRCAYRMALAGETVSDCDLRPLYLRVPQAERERLARLHQNQE